MCNEQMNKEIVNDCVLNAKYAFDKKLNRNVKILTVKNEYYKRNYIQIYYTSNICLIFWRDFEKNKNAAQSVWSFNATIYKFNIIGILLLEFLVVPINKYQKRYLFFVFFLKKISFSIRINVQIRKFLFLLFFLSTVS